MLFNCFALIEKNALVQVSHVARPVKKAVVRPAVKVVAAKIVPAVSSKLVKVQHTATHK
jgi:hypothetical protein